VNRGVEGAVFITGVYGSGKSSVAQEIAYLLEEQNAPYALLDLDFLGWFDVGGEGGPTEQSVMLQNLAALVGNYSAVGVRFFVLAGAIRDAVELDDLKAEFPMPLRIVRLIVPLAEIEKRLRPDDGQASRPARGGSVGSVLRRGRHRGGDGLERASYRRGGVGHLGLARLGRLCRNVSVRHYANFSERRLREVRSLFAF
jgi:hypothetical protein